MERLQEALKRAREQRAEGQAQLTRDGQTAQTLDRPPLSGGVSQPAGGQSVGEAWAAVEEFTPVPRIMRKNRIISYFGGIEASSFDIMRTKIVHQANAKNAKRLVVTSPSPACGKTTTITNLAFSLARQPDIKTVLIDVDLRRPTLGSVLGVQKPLQFSEALARRAPLEEHMLRIGDNLLVGTNAVPAQQPSELLQSKSARETIEEIERRYQPDFLLFDALPVLTSDDTIGVLEFCDAAIIVAAAEQSSIEELDVTEAEVSNVSDVIGVVLNKCRYASNNYDYY